MSERKIAEYWEYFKKPFLELYEFCDLLVGNTETGLMYTLDPHVSKELGIDSFRAEPVKLNEFGEYEFENARDTPLYKSIFKRVLKAISDDEICSHTIKL